MVGEVLMPQRGGCCRRDVLLHAQVQGLGGLEAKLGALADNMEATQKGKDIEVVPNY